MAVPSSGTISLAGIWNELNSNDYSATEHGTAEDISLKECSDGTKSIINTAPANDSNRPNRLAPHSMTEFYSYNHDEYYYFAFSNFAKHNGSKTTNYNAWDTGEYILHLKPNSGTTVGSPSADKRCTTTYRVVTSGSEFTRAWCFVEVRAAGSPSSFIRGAAGSASKYTFDNQEDSVTSGITAGPRRPKHFFVDKITDYVLSMSTAEN